MIERILTVGGFTLLSRVTGFVRDIMLAAVLGAGPVADAFFVALRLPNHFRAIFAEGAFNAAFVPAYARIREQGGAERARLFADRIFTLLLASQIVLLAVALIFTPEVIDLLAPGFCARSGALRARGRAHAHHLSLSAADHAGDALRRHPQCAAALRRRRRRADPAQSVDDGGAAAGGVLSDRRPCGGLGRADLPACCKLLLVGGDAWRAGALPVLRWPQLDADVRQFFRALGPATVGSAGVQLALFADTIIASFLPTGALSALYYADRINQLPIGVIGIAAGTVVLPEMARRIAAGDEAGARARAEPRDRVHAAAGDPLRRRLLRRARTDHARAVHARRLHRRRRAAPPARTLAAYAFGLLPFVLIRSAVATFFARGDTATPVKAALIAAAVNIGFKISADGAAGAGRPCARDLDRRLDQSRSGDLVCRIAPATSASMSACGSRRSSSPPPGSRWRPCCGSAARRLARCCSQRWPRCATTWRRCWPWRASPALVYGAIVVALFGRRLAGKAFARRRCAAEAAETNS